MKRIFFSLMAACAVLFSCEQLEKPKDENQSQQDPEKDPDNGQGEEPEEKPVQTFTKYVATLSSRYVENVAANSSLSLPSFTFKYDDQNRVTEVKSENVTCTFDYSQAGKIVVRENGKDYDAILGEDGMVNEMTVQAGTMGSGDYKEDYTISRNSHGDVTQIISHFYGPNFESVSGMVFSYDASNVLTAITTVNYDSGNNEEYREEVPYRYNYASPNINVDLNWLLLSGGLEGTGCLIWLSQAGRLGSRLIEWPTMYQKSSRPSMGGSSDKPAGGPYHYETKYGVVGSVAGMAVQNDTDSCPSKITFTMNIDEYKFVCDYMVDEYGQIEVVSEEYKPTGTVLGTNDFEILLTYKE